jgi:hypothetical protein
MPSLTMRGCAARRFTSWRADVPEQFGIDVRAERRRQRRPGRQTWRSDAFRRSSNIGGRIRRHRDRVDRTSGRALLALTRSSGARIARSWNA